MEKEIEWGYSLENGPDTWINLCDDYRQACNRYMQSPIALAKDKVTNQLEKDTLTIEYLCDEFQIQWSKHTFHFIPKSNKNKVYFDRKCFYLDDIHFHIPSEHTLDGQVHPIEFHFVHHSEADEPLVIAVLFKKIVGNEELLQIEESCTTINWDLRKKNLKLNPSVFISKPVEYYAYYGSYTTPPCVGNVQWIVVSKASSLFSKTILKLVKEKDWASNNRPIQPQEQKKIWHT
ncbi:carbonic anhydrase [Enterococcus sp. DIV0212c]|uniref:carbonic anhydrase n=1 Tax=Candidatus Enterococcus ikei TaxID=2815326 RepID=A0ABS3GVQ0_9ENTE|nr:MULTISPECIES: carbonic anhydrase family protein [unclassified Enterococcus]MBO0439331.1 carbonic anhydrase family protein [Enterococcus sp. DIV0869a]MBO1354913.1 carbonic anhydrase family protein [Enterococcus sp. DIV0212c]